MRFFYDNLYFCWFARTIGLKKLDKKGKFCLVSCSVLRDELEKLVKEGGLDSELVFVSKFFHVDYDALEKNLRRVLEHTLKRFKGSRVILCVWGLLSWAGQ